MHPMTTSKRDSAPASKGPPSHDARSRDLRGLLIYAETLLGPLQAKRWLDSRLPGVMAGRMTVQQACDTPQGYLEALLHLYGIEGPGSLERVRNGAHMRDRHEGIF